MLILSTLLTNSIDTVKKPKTDTEDTKEPTPDTKKEKEPVVQCRLCFVNNESRKRCKELIGHDNGEHAISHIVQTQQSNDESLAEVMIQFGTGEQGEIGNTRFYLLDTARTYIQMKAGKILSIEEACRIIDLCPHQLHGNTLIRILAVTPMGNAEVLRRMMLNGIFVTPSTIAKRLSSALGGGDWSKPLKDFPVATRTTKEWFDANGEHFKQYTEFRGRMRALLRGRHMPRVYSPEVEFESVEDRKKGSKEAASLKRASSDPPAFAPVDKRLKLT